MAVIFLNQPLHSIGDDDAALKEMGYRKVYGSIIPLSPGGDEVDEDLFKKLKSARKRERKIKKKCEELAKKALNDFTAASKTYLSSKHCLFVALFELNKKSRIEDRLSLQALWDLTVKYDILKKLNEPVSVWDKPKSSGNGKRTIASFGPVASAAQHMVKKLLRFTYEPQGLQFQHLSFSQKVEHAITSISAKGHKHVIEIDIEGFFPSFTEEALLKTLDLPNEAIRQIVMSNGANCNPHLKKHHKKCISLPSGLPQGSASSAAVADWCVANMHFQDLTDATVINHADNFFVFAASKQAAEGVSKALSFAITEAPGGNFKGIEKQSKSLQSGFSMLGCNIEVSTKGNAIVSPSEANLEKLSEETSKLVAWCENLLRIANKTNSKIKRLRGLQEFLRLEGLYNGWLHAFAFCGSEIEVIKEDARYVLKLLRYEFDIHDYELKPLMDTSTNAACKWYSGC